jgi:Fur family transcriptional regulator, ferric uptake regulator
MKVDSNKTSCETLLLSKNISITAMRILTIDFIMHQKNAVSLSEIEQHFFKSDRITLYRTLKTFEKKGLIHSIQENNTTKYSLCSDSCTEDNHKDNHLHFFCSNCKTTICLDNIELSQLHFHKNFQIKELRFFAKGLCDKCQ